MSEKRRMLAGKLYVARDAELAVDNKKNRVLSRLFNATTEEQLDYRKQLLKELFGTIGEDIYIEPPFRSDYGANIHIGEHFYANYDCIILDVAEVRIGDNVFFGPRVGLYTATHPIDSGVRNQQLEYGLPIHIGNNVWIGGNAVINPGVTIGDNTVIGSGSVVTRDIPANVIAAGNPCRVIREITDADTRYWEEKALEYVQEKKQEEGEIERRLHVDGNL